MVGSHLVRLVLHGVCCFYVLFDNLGKHILNCVCLPAMTNITSNKASTHTQNLLALALYNATNKKPALFAFFGEGTFGRPKRYNWAFRPSPQLGRVLHIVNLQPDCTINYQLQTAHF